MINVLAILAAGVVTFALRAAFLVHDRLRPPKAVERYLPLVGPAVLGAIALPGLLAPEGEMSVLAAAPALVAALVAVIVQRLTRQLVLGLVAGLLVWWGLLALFALLGLG